MGLALDSLKSQFPKTHDALVKYLELLDQCSMPAAERATLKAAIASLVFVAATEGAKVSPFVDAISSVLKKSKR